MTAPKLAGCLYCIEGFEPSGVHLYLGPIYMHCNACLDNGDLAPCLACNSDALFPAGFDRLEDLLHHLAGYGLAAVICLGCYGVTDFRAIEDLTGGTP